MKHTINIEGIYHDYLLDKNEERIEPEKFTASSAGYCFKKQIYGISEHKPEEFDERTLRLFRLGTLVHEDIQKAITEKVKPPIKCIIEGLVHIDELNVTGHYDLAFFLEDSKHINLFDIKTIASYKWTKQFGREHNRDKNPSVNYELQVGTYAYGLRKQYHPESIEMNFLWYKKDNSDIKIKSIDPIWEERAIDYWTELNDVHSEIDLLDVPAHSMPNVPVMDWECKYCNYSKLCEETK